MTVVPPPPSPIAPPVGQAGPSRSGHFVDPVQIERWETVDVPRKLKRFGVREMVEVAGPFAAATVAGLTLCRFFSWGGLLGPALVVLVIFLLLYSKVARSCHGQLAATDRIIGALVFAGAGSAVAALASLLLYVIVKGLPQLRPGFFVQDMGTIGPLDEGGGALHAIVGTLQQVGIAALVALPVAILTAVYLNEIKGPMSRMVRFLVDAMSGVPSIVAGLFIYAAWVVSAGAGPSGLAASLALIVLMIPTVTRTSEEVLRTIPDGLREASLALGAPQWRAVLKVVLPTGRSGLLTAALLGVARIVGETAPPLLTAKGAPAVNANPFQDQQSSLPVFIYQLLRQPSEAQLQRAYTGMLVLLILVGLLFTLARVAGGRGPAKR